MPDKTKKTVSASQIGALYEQSPYVTEYMLWQSFANGIDIEKEAHARMNWGLLMQPLVLAEAAKDLRLEITPNVEDTYRTFGSLGCTIDAEIRDPQQGNVVVECKCVFDWNIWYTDWSGGKRPPPHIELQLQCQMAVGDGETPYQRGVIVAWVGGELHYFWRDLDADLVNDMETMAGDFLYTVEKHIEPPAFGDEKELPIIALRWPKIEKVEQKLDDSELAEKAVMRVYAKEQASFWKKTAEKYDATILDACEDYASTYLPEGVIVNVSKSQTKDSTIALPDEICKRLAPIASSLDGKAEGNAIAAALDWLGVTRKGGVRTTIKVVVPDKPVAKPVDDSTPLDGG